jgi:hypothetical protein
MTERGDTVKPMTGRRWWCVSVLLGIAAGLVWWAITDTGRWVITAAGATMSEGQSQRQFGAVVTFVIIGAVACTLFGLIITLAVGEHWWLVPAVALMSGFAAGLAWLVGHLLGPDGPSKADRGSIGAHVPAALTIDTAAPFVAWAVFGVAGVLVGTWVLDRKSAQGDGR